MISKAASLTDKFIMLKTAVRNIYGKNHKTHLALDRLMHMFGAKKYFKTTQILLYIQPWPASLWFSVYLTGFLENVSAIFKSTKGITVIIIMILTSK